MHNEKRMYFRSKELPKLAHGWQWFIKLKNWIKIFTILRFFIYIKGWDDIGYNFIVGEDGNVYEGLV